MTNEHSLNRSFRYAPYMDGYVKAVDDDTDSDHDHLPSTLVLNRRVDDMIKDQLVNANGPSPDESHSLLFYMELWEQRMLTWNSSRHKECNQSELDALHSHAVDV